MRIRKDQFDYLLQQYPEAFLETLIAHLRQESPELIADIPSDSLREMVANGLTRARSHGLRRDEDLIAFVSVMFEIAPNFDEHPAIRRVLDDPSVPVDDRFDSLFSRVPDEAWTEAEESYDSDAWFPELRNQ